MSRIMPNYAKAFEELFGIKTYVPNCASYGGSDINHYKYNFAVMFPLHAVNHSQASCHKFMLTVFKQPCSATAEAIDLWFEICR